MIASRELFVSEWAIDRALGVVEKCQLWLHPSPRNAQSSRSELFSILRNYPVNATAAGPFGGLNSTPRQEGKLFEGWKYFVDFGGKSIDKFESIA